MHLLVTALTAGVNATRHNQSAMEVVLMRGNLMSQQISIQHLSG